MGWLNLSAADQMNVLNQVSTRTGLSPQSLEKDWWVTMVLKALFSMPFAVNLSFKGGTSLSKCWQLIQRMSEDVDIAVDREFLGFTGELSKTQISDKLRRAACTFTREVLKDQLKRQMDALAIDESLYTIEVAITSVTTTDPETIEVHFKSLFSTMGYIQSKVLVEVSGRSMSDPKETVLINSLISQSFPQSDFAMPDFAVEAVSPKRTFLEKACLLHEEFYKKAEEIRVDRMSRHIYDLEKLMGTPIAEEALGDGTLYKAVVDHRKKFIGLKGFDYDSLLPKHISFVPPPSVLASWKDDYIKMQSSMIYGASLPFEKLLERMQELNNWFKKATV